MNISGSSMANVSDHSHQSMMEDSNDKKINKFSGLKIKTVPSITKRKRTNYRLRKSIVPKCPLMVLNEMIGSVNYSFVENSTPSLANGANQHFTAVCTIEGKNYEATGLSKQIAKNNCAELAIQAIVAQKCKGPKKTVDSEGNPIKHYQMEDETPWAQLSSFALFKLFNDWQVRGFDVPKELLRPPSDTESNYATTPKLDKAPGNPISEESKSVRGVSKKIPDNPTERHPVQLLNEMKGGVSYNLIEERPTTPVTFVMSAFINGIKFTGEGKNKKDAKRNCACNALKQIYGIVYPNKE
eukprot:TRINITY_DN321_c0_g2_i1.p1 TRINITY_DN321_c0_g2~~TRINITY_DN321_c0_g2_i1.p1  ORF type:complete len:298 (-),score=105.85 TRINITY_DN321_c0_g2_i1:287-1180(-)